MASVFPGVVEVVEVPVPVASEPERFPDPKITPPSIEGDAVSALVVGADSQPANRITANRAAMQFFMG
jgi:hypothetical protein